MSKTLLIICPKQFGYLSDYYYYCLNLTDYRIIYVGKDQGLKSVEVPANTEVYHLSTQFFSPKAISFIKKSGFINKNFILFVYYHRLCFLYTLFLSNKIKILDVRSGDVSPNCIKRNVLNAFLKAESFFFKKIFIISESLRKDLKLSKRKSSIVPLGAVEIGYQKKDFCSMNLLYVGTFFNRNIEATVQGVSMFKCLYPEIPLTYTIIGFGPSNDIHKIESEIEYAGFPNGEVRYIGRLHHSELTDYFMHSNVGVSFIPLVKYFDCQPPTKTFEYICSGLVCIATATSENKKIINESNGILINDDPVSFSKGLKMIWDNRDNYDTDKIRGKAAEHHWYNIVNRFFRPALENIVC